MWLVLCGADDLAALWAYQGLKARGLSPLELVSDGALACALRWEHRLGAGGPSTAVTLADGRTIRGDEIAGVLNRLLILPSGHMRAASPADRDYAGQELVAFFTSWLYALPRPVLNRPTPQGLCGRWRPVSEWVWMASRAGLPAPHYVRTMSGDGAENFARRLAPQDASVMTAIVVAGRVVGASLPPDISEGCRRLARLAGTQLLGVEFYDGEAGPWTFAGATPFPDLRLGGPALLGALATALQSGRTDAS
ncbi:MAG: hypothetical protein ACRD68_12340 [Pyrinomonadaceae bacterium]